MRLIDADELKAVYIPSEIEGFEKMMVPVEVALQNIDDMPTVDAVPVIRCGKCSFWDRDHISCEGLAKCLTGESGIRYRNRNDFCSRGKQKDGNSNVLY